MATGARGAGGPGRRRGRRSAGRPSSRGCRGARSPRSFRGSRRRGRSVSRSPRRRELQRVGGPVAPGDGQVQARRRAKGEAQQRRRADDGRGHRHPEGERERDSSRVSPAGENRTGTATRSFHILVARPAPQPHGSLHGKPAQARVPRWGVAWGWWPARLEAVRVADEGRRRRTRATASDCGPPARPRLAYPSRPSVPARGAFGPRKGPIRDLRRPLTRQDLPRTSGRLLRFAMRTASALLTLPPEATVVSWRKVLDRGAVTPRWRDARELRRGPDLR